MENSYFRVHFQISQFQSILYDELLCLEGGGDANNFQTLILDSLCQTFDSIHHRGPTPNSNDTILNGTHTRHSLGV